MPAFRYPEATAHGGHLAYDGPVPVLTVAGGPAEIGRQAGELALRPAVKLLDYPADYLRSRIKVPGLPWVIGRLVRRPCRRLFGNVPAEYRAEVDALAGCGFDCGRLVAANTLFDMSHMGSRPLFGCSAVMARPARSATGGTLLARSLDFFPLGYLHDFSLVTVYRPAPGRLGFASLGFPGVVGCFSGMNAAGVCVTRNEVLTPGLRQPYDPAGVPFAMALRQVLETCRTVGAAVESLRRTRHATASIVAVADPTDACVAELTPAGVTTRPADGLAACTNHFHPAVDTVPPNLYRTLDRLTDLNAFAATAGSAVGVPELWAALDRVHQGELTVQSMVFDPAARDVYVSFGPGPTSARPPHRLVLGGVME